jgi:hypothetical protein
VAGTLERIESIGGDGKLSDKVSVRESGAKHICGVDRASLAAARL